MHQTILSRGRGGKEGRRGRKRAMGHTSNEFIYITIHPTFEPIYAILKLKSIGLTDALTNDVSGKVESYGFGYVCDKTKKSFKDWRDAPIETINAFFEVI